MDRLTLAVLAEQHPLACIEDHEKDAWHAACYAAFFCDQSDDDVLLVSMVAARTAVCYADKKWGKSTKTKVCGWPGDRTEPAPPEFLNPV